MHINVRIPSDLNLRLDGVLATGKSAVHKLTRQGLPQASRLISGTNSHTNHNSPPWFIYGCARNADSGQGTCLRQESTGI